MLRLEADGKTDEAIALLKTELTATKTVKPPGGSLAVPDHTRQLSALWVALGSLKKRG
jgi:hypothetical protein